MGKASMSEVRRSPGRLARTTAVLYLLVVFTGVAAEILVRNWLLVPEDAAATVVNITAHQLAFRFGFLISLSRFAIFILMILALHRLLRAVDADVSLTMVVLALIGITIGMVVLLFQYAAPLLLSSNRYSAAYTPAQLHVQVQFFIDMQLYGDRAAQVLSVWLIPCGYLVYRSGYLPAALGVLLMVAGVGYVADFVVFLLLPELEWQVAGLAFLAEIPFPLWLLIKGVDAEQWRSRALGARATTI